MTCLIEILELPNFVHIKKIFKDSKKKLKELEIMHQNAVYICIFWYSKICWFLMKKC